MIVPVLVAGAGMASESALPEALRPIARYQAIQIHDDRFDDGVEQLASVLRTVPGLTSFDLNGEWTADRERTDAFAICRRLRPFSCSFIFFVVADLIRGSVTYPTGDAVIEDGAVVGRRINFRTSHVAQFEEVRATIRFTGEIVKDKLHLRYVKVAEIGPPPSY